MAAVSLMIQGTTSDSGKSAVVTGLCRALHRRGIGVAPFKPQNMANNSAVTPAGGEIGRSQAVQARAAGLDPTPDMNPVLLKPDTDTGAQVVLGGQVMGTMDALGYHAYKRTARDEVLAAYRRLTTAFEAVIVEGAGSPAEINLREGDIANMGFAEAVDCPVALVADIDRGGVFAQLVGTRELLSPSERQRLEGFVINRFRGDRRLLEPGLDWLEDHTGVPVLGVLPHLDGLHLEAEDRIDPEGPAQVSPEHSLKVRVPALPRISNHTDLDPLRLHPRVDLRFAGVGDSLDGSDLLVLPGSKSVRSDLEWLRQQGWDEAIRRHLRYGGKVVGICGGLQMLGKSLSDPLGLEGPPGTSEGLGLLDLATELAPEKRLARTRGRLTIGEAEVTGYEIHMGTTAGRDLERPAAHLANGPDGARSGDDRILGTYLHGLFEATEARQALLGWAGLADLEPFDYDAAREAGLDRLADAVEENLLSGPLRELLRL